MKLRLIIFILGFIIVQNAKATICYCRDGYGACITDPTQCDDNSTNGAGY